MKTLTKHLTKILLTFILIIVSNCQKDDTLIQQDEVSVDIIEPDSGITARKVTIDEIPKIVGFIEQNHSTQQRDTSSGNYVVTPFGNIPLEDITEVTDTLGNTNYTFAIIPNTIRENKFYNLVISQNESSLEPSSQIVEYSMNEAFANELSNGETSLSNFTGTIKRFNTDDFLNSFNRDSRTPCEEDPSVIPTDPSCDPVDLNDGSSEDDGDIGNDNSDGNNDGSSGGGGTSGEGTTGDGDGSNSSNGNGGDDGTGGYDLECLVTETIWDLDCECEYVVVKSCEDYFGNSQRTTNSSCNNDGPMAIIPVPFEKLYITLGITEAENDTCLEPNCDLKNSIRAYLNRNIEGLDYSDEATAFSQLVAEELVDDCAWDFEVDFEDNIIYTITKDCQEEIVKNIIEVSSPLTNLINNTFGETENANVKFWNGDIPDSNAYTNPFFSGTGDNFTINIKFDDSYLDTATNLSIVATTLHELVHAYFLNLYIKGELTATSTDYETLLNAFVSFYNDPNDSTFDPLDSEIHNAMEDFINQMANSLYNYAQTEDIPNVDADYCIALAWGTMHGTELFSNVLTPSEQQHATNILITEQDNTEYDPSYPIKGTDCE